MRGEFPFQMESFVALGFLSVALSSVGGRKQDFQRILEVLWNLAVWAWEQKGQGDSNCCLKMPLSFIPHSSGGEEVQSQGPGS